MSGGSRVAADGLGVLFLCTANSARSIMAEALLRALGGDRFRAFSTGSRPAGAIHPLALEVLVENRLPVDELHSKGVAAFSGPGAPRLDLVVTVCDAAAREPCPVWPGAPATAHWSLPDPAAAPGTEAERRRHFEATLAELRRRVEALVAQPVPGNTAELALRASAIEATAGDGEGGPARG